MKHRQKKWLGALLAAALTASFAACSSNNNPTRNDGGGASRDLSYLPTPNHPVDPSKRAWQQQTANGNLSWYINFDWFTNLTYGQDTVTRQMLKDTKTTVKWTSGNDDRLNTMIASNSLPDLVTVAVNSAPDMMLRKNAEKILYPLDDLAKKYAPTFLSAEDGAKAETVKWWTADNGHFYGYPSYSLTTQDYDNPNLTGTSAFLVRSDMYEALGKPDMTTPDGFLAALKVAKEKYPDVVGFSATSMATGGALNETLQNFLAIPKSKEGEPNDRVSDPTYRKWLETIRQAHADGYMSDDDFADTQGDKFKQRLHQSGYFAILAEGTPQLSTDINQAAEKAPDKAYIAVDGPKNDNGDKPQLTQTGISGWTITYVTKKAKDPQRAMEMIEYLVNDAGQQADYYGTEGETFQMKDGKPQLLPEVKKLQASDDAAFKKKYRMGEIWMLGNDMYKINLGVSHEDDTPTMAQIFDWTKGKMHPNFDVENMDPSGKTIEAKSLANINNKWNTTLVGMVRAGSVEDANRLFDAFIKFRDANNWTKIQEYRTKQIAANVQKLG